MSRAADKHPQNRLPGVLRRIHLPLQIFLATLTLHFTYPLAEIHLRHDDVVLNILAAMAILSAAWLVMRAVEPQRRTRWTSTPDARRTLPGSDACTRS